MRYFRVWKIEVLYVFVEMTCALSFRVSSFYADEVGYIRLRPV